MTTESIRIELQVEQLRRSGNVFRVIALEPNRAAPNESVTHPHVDDGRLCSGDAAVPLERALNVGRIADAFCLVHGVLSHYNPGSPYVALEEWDGLECTDCGGSMARDEVWRCDGCDLALCSECQASAWLAGASAVRSV